MNKKQNITSSKDVEKLLSKQTIIILNAVDQKLRRVDRRFDKVEKKIDDIDVA